MSNALWGSQTGKSMRIRDASIDTVPLFETKEIIKNFKLNRFIYGVEDAVHDPDFRYFHGLSENLVFCDIGANTGQSINSLRLLGSRAILHSFEINPTIWPKIEEQAARYAGPFTLHKHGVSERGGSFKLYLPVFEGFICHGLGSLSLESLQSERILNIMASLVPPNRAEEWEVIATICEVRDFDSLGLKPDIVKIDVEGAEMMVLAGMCETLRTARPTLLIENSDPAAFRVFLAEFGYMPLCYDQGQDSFSFGLSVSGNNTFFMHVQDVHALAAKGKISGGNEKQPDIARSRVAMDFYTENLSRAPTQEDVVAAFRTFFGVSPSEHQLMEHLATHPTRREMRNALIKYLIGNL